MARPYKLGLTGSIGMGKSTTADMFADDGVPVWDADSAVAKLYGAAAIGSLALARLVPDAVTDQGVDKARLRAAIQADSTLLAQIEAVVHPLLAADRQEFMKSNAAQPIVVFDLPLLYETKAELWLDGVLVVTAPPDVQHARVLARPNMTPEFLENIHARQLPDADKRRRADWVIDTSAGLDAARHAVLALLAQLRDDLAHA